MTSAVFWKNSLSLSLSSARLSEYKIQFRAFRSRPVSHLQLSSVAPEHVVGQQHLTVRVRVRGRMENRSESAWPIGSRDRDYRLARPELQRNETSCLALLGAVPRGRTETSPRRFVLLGVYTVQSNIDRRRLGRSGKL